MMKFLVLSLLLWVSVWSQEGLALSHSATSIFTILKENDFEKQKTVLAYNESLPKEYLNQKIEKIRKFDFSQKKIMGEINTKTLFSLIIEEKPGDLDPIVFVKTQSGLKMLLNMTRLRDSGYEKNEEFVEDMKKIDEYCRSLKKQK